MQIWIFGSISQQSQSTESTLNAYRATILSRSQSTMPSRSLFDTNDIPFITCFSVSYFVSHCSRILTPSAFQQCFMSLRFMGIWFSKSVANNISNVPQKRQFMHLFLVWVDLGRAPSVGQLDHYCPVCVAAKITSSYPMSTNMLDSWYEEICICFCQM